MAANTNYNNVFDVCIVGAGPAGLATLSALHSPYSLEGGTMTESQKERALKYLKLLPKKSICVVDQAAGWMESWQTNFDTLSIEYLRSPALAHPDMFDPNALLSYAVRHGREEELLESGCGDMKKLFALGQSQIGLWKLPSTRLFVDFCLDLAKSLSHCFIGETLVTEINHLNDIRGKKERFRLALSNGMNIYATAVVLAVGAAGHPIVPTCIQRCPRVHHWTSLSTFTKRKEGINCPVMVVGGGLTAVQVALKQLNIAEKATSDSIGLGPQVILVSKRPLVEKHFDINVEWFDLRKANKCISDFYHHPMGKRSQALKEARRGGSVPPMYMMQLVQAEQDGRLLCLVGDIESDAYKTSNSPTTRVRVHHRASPKRNVDKPHHLNDTFNAVSLLQVKEIIVACGVHPDCKKPRSLTAMVHSKWPIQVESGLPCVTQDLRWKEGLDLFVVGSLGSLNIGPDAGNLMGIRRAAQIVANALGSRSWLRGSVLANPFEALEWSSDDDSIQSDEEADDYRVYKELLDVPSSTDDTDVESFSDSSTLTASGLVRLAPHASAPHH
ncbi:hypothetical protein ACA910_013647 [Epithemia clementina (nom. ined.)]